MRPAIIVAVAGLVAAVLALGAALLARTQGQDINLWLTVGTALLIAVFLALVVLAPRTQEPSAEGFKVTHAETKAEVVTEPREPSEGRRDGRSGDGSERQD